MEYRITIEQKQGDAKPRDTNSKLQQAIKRKGPPMAVSPTPEHRISQRQSTHENGEDHRNGWDSCAEMASKSANPHNFEDQCAGTGNKNEQEQQRWTGGSRS
jgi:hypothetical protein